MGVDYRKQYRPEELEPFWPNEIIKMSVAVLCTLAVIMFFAILPSLLEAAGVGALGHEEQPANPRGATPVGIKPEWYFLAVYQYLRLMPMRLLGISGKTLGVLTQGLGVATLVLLPFWYRKRASRRPGVVYKVVITAAVVAFLCLTVWGGWPEQLSGGDEALIPFSQYVHERPIMFTLIAATLIIFYPLIWLERRTVRRVLSGASPHSPGRKEVRT